MVTSSMLWFYGRFSSWCVFHFKNFTLFHGLNWAQCACVVCCARTTFAVTSLPIISYYESEFNAIFETKTWKQAKVVANKWTSYYRLSTIYKRSVSVIRITHYTLHITGHSSESVKTSEEVNGTPNSKVKNFWTSTKRHHKRRSKCFVYNRFFEKQPNKRRHNIE